MLWTLTYKFKAAGINHNNLKEGTVRYRKVKIGFSEKNGIIFLKNLIMKIGKEFTFLNSNYVVPNSSKGLGLLKNSVIPSIKNEDWMPANESIWNKGEPFEEISNAFFLIQIIYKNYYILCDEK